MSIAYNHRAPTNHIPFMWSTMELGRNRSAMPGKLTLLLKSKLAWAILGAILIVGAGSTAALAATGTPLPLISQGQTSQHNDGQHNDGQHDHNDNGHQ